MCLCCTTSLEPFPLSMRFPGLLNLSTSPSGGEKGWNMVCGGGGCGGSGYKPLCDIVDFQVNVDYDASRKKRQEAFQEDAFPPF